MHVSKQEGVGGMLCSSAIVLWWGCSGGVPKQLPEGGGCRSVTDALQGPNKCDDYVHVEVTQGNQRGNAERQAVQSSGVSFNPGPQCDTRTSERVAPQGLLYR